MIVCAYISILIYNDDVQIHTRSFTFTNLFNGKVDEQSMKTENSIEVYSSNERNLNMIEKTSDNIENSGKELLILTWTRGSRNSRIWFENALEGMHIEYI